ncbi:MAG: exonuclease domain-containing protein [Acidimicrobiales bacterium]
MASLRIHGITPAMCHGAPEWPDALDRLVEIITGRLVVAHYAPFDISVIRHTCDDTGLSRPKLEFACTCRLARMVWACRLTTQAMPNANRTVHIA